MLNIIPTISLLSLFTAYQNFKLKLSKISFLLIVPLTNFLSTKNKAVFFDKTCLNTQIKF